MRLIIGIFIIFSLAGQAMAERLPDHAKLDTTTPSEGPGQALNGTQMASLYLQSPVLVSNDKSKSGMAAVTDQDRYLSPEKHYQRNRNKGGIPASHTAPPPEPKPAGNILDLLPLLSNSQ